MERDSRQGNSANMEKEGQKMSNADLMKIIFGESLDTFKEENWNIPAIKKLLYDNVSDGMKESKSLDKCLPGAENSSKVEQLTMKEKIRCLLIKAYGIYMTFQRFIDLFIANKEELQKLVNELKQIADELDIFHRRTTVASVTGGAVSIAGGITTIVGLILIPFTFGASVIVTAVGLGVAGAGGLASSSANITDMVNNSLDRKKVTKIIDDYQKKIKPIEESLDNINKDIEFLEMLKNSRKNHEALGNSTGQMLPSISAGSKAGRGLFSVMEMARMIQVARLAAGALRVAKMAAAVSGVLSGLLIGLDIFFLAKDSKDLHKGAKTKLAAKIRQAAEELETGLKAMEDFKEALKRYMGQGEEKEMPAPLPPQDPALLKKPLKQLKKSKSKHLK